MKEQASESSQPANALMNLYLGNRTALVRFFTARTGSAAEAEDLVQSLYSKVVQIDDASIRNGLTYLYRLGLNLMVDRIRSSRSRHIREDEYQRTQAGEIGGRESSGAPSPESAVDARLRLERLLVAVRSLPPQCRRVFEMHKLDGMSHGEVAQALSISRSAVEKHMINALRHLRDAG